ncbi:hypothetical protein AAMO2058_000251900 [Amorphochlora amoebiformis]
MCEVFSESARRCMVSIVVVFGVLTLGMPGKGPINLSRKGGGEIRRGGRTRLIRPWFLCKSSLKMGSPIPLPTSSSSLQRSIGYRESTKPPKERLRILLEKSQNFPESKILDSVVKNATQLSQGFCNYVWLINRPSDEKLNSSSRVVAKVYSALHSLRTDRETWGAVDRLASDCGLGPSVVFDNEIGIIHDFLPGRVLEDKDMLKSSPTLVPLAQKLSRLHSTDIPSVYSSREPLIWDFLTRMLDEIVRRETHYKPHQKHPQENQSRYIFLSSNVLRREIEICKKILRPHHFPSVLAHGDCKPANAMTTLSEPIPLPSEPKSLPSEPKSLSKESNVSTEANSVYLIDFELSGPNYRGYDIMKLFRKLPGPERDEAMREFLNVYIEESGPGVPDVEDLMRECEMLEPLTWLEAVVFFALVLHIKPDQETEWVSLGRSRWQNYLKAKQKMLDHHRLAISDT